jgi:hypothetical protein
MKPKKKKSTGNGTKVVNEGLIYIEQNNVALDHSADDFARLISAGG